MRVLFFGYSQIGYRAVELLVERGDEVLGVVTHRDDPHENRWYKTPAEAAATHALPIVYSEDLEDAGAVLAANLAPDLILSVFYRSLLPDAVLAAARIAALNLHPSLLPAYRGRAPINWALVHGERETGITLHHMARRADAGDIVAQRRIPIAPRATALSLYLEIEQAGIELLADALPQVANGTAPRIVQDESKASKVGRRRPEDGRIDWSWPAARVDCLVRAVAPPWPGAFGTIGGRRVEIHAGEPEEEIAADSAGTHPVPGTVDRIGERIRIATADRWFRIDESSGLDETLPAP
ncbi:MAG TPA: formyltransferase family protein [Thermoanaerobaculia bacterium]|nr:formyltransferase family protein [Thermoanaerobaculia bacterium]